MDTSQHQRRWPPIQQTLGRCRFVLATSSMHYQTRVLLDAAPGKHEALNQCWFDAKPASQTVGQHSTSIESTSCLLGVLKSHIVFRTSVWGSKRNNKFRLIHGLYCPQEPFNNTNYKSHWHTVSYQPLWLCCWRGDISSFLFTKN